MGAALMVVVVVVPMALLVAECRDETPSQLGSLAIGEARFRMRG